MDSIKTTSEKSNRSSITELGNNENSKHSKAKYIGNRAEDGLKDDATNRGDICHYMDYNLIPFQWCPPGFFHSTILTSILKCHLEHCCFAQPT